MSESKDTGPEAAARGVVEDVKGKVKEAAGVIADMDDLRDEGRAQQKKASAEREVAAKEAQAEKARAEAEAHE
ncbi:MAG TPA: CsbD family protein, partial [Acidimicrobiales bacterium]|nr:CsbD family protein [Acidimicrobiales bacterium]